MPELHLTGHDLLQLSAKAREEILQLFGFSGRGEPSDSSPQQSSSNDHEWYPVSRPLLPKCIASISPRSIRLLKLLAENHGRVKWSVIRDTLQIAQWQDLKAMLAGMNRRVRTVTGDDATYFVSWDESEDEFDSAGRYVDGYLKVHPETARSLRSYFGMA